MGLKSLPYTPAKTTCYQTAQHVPTGDTYLPMQGTTTLHPTVFANIYLYELFWVHFLHGLE